MTFHRTIFFLLLAFFISAPFFVNRLWWLAHSRRAVGVQVLEGMGELGDQMPLNYTIICFRLGKDTICFNGLGNLHLRDGTAIPVRYQETDPYDAKVNIFEGIWGDTVVYSGIPLLMLLFIALNRDIVPRRKRVWLAFKRPWIRVVG
jgi:hypothetical protein